MLCNDAQGQGVSKSPMNLGKLRTYITEILETTVIVGRPHLIFLYLVPI